MPRTGGIYYLPSPPAPLVPDTLAAAEDMNTLFQDLATAMTGSMAVDGSTAFTGPVNFNNQAISGIGNLAANGNITCANLTVTAGANINYLVNSINANGQNITGGGTFSASAINSGSSMWIVGGTLGSAMNANGQNINSVGNMNANQFSANGVTSGYYTANGDVNMNGHNIVGTAGLYGSLNFNNQTNFNALVNINGQLVANVGNISGWNGMIGITNDTNFNGHNLLNVGTFSGYGGTIHMSNTLNMNGNAIVNASYQLSAPTAAVARVRAMAAARVGELDLVETLSTLIAAVAELSSTPVPA